ncbi:MAG: cycA1, partial [Phycisphaerales bacterium]|nr:cycA1 [Phycisphaerales bacterium]
ELSQLAADLPEVDAVVGGPTGQALAPRSVGPSLLAAATNKGKFLVQLDLPAAGASGRLGGKVAEMGPSIPDQDAQLANLRQYLATLGERDFSAAESGLTPPLPADAPADYRIAGSESCAACHRAENESWAHSGHGHAWQTLQPRGFHVDPYCLQCHTTGYGQAGGFVSVRRSAALVGVGCENCHGPSQAHVHDPKVRTPFVALDQCVRCHDHENSPNFARDAFWAKIRHGKAAADRTTPGRAGGGRAKLEVQP